jgi:O-antigen/teichoic acid export membrane protein
MASCVVRLTAGYLDRWWRMAGARLQADHMVRNSLYLILSSGLQAGLGFMFWVITARLFSTADVGRASSLVSATVVIAYLALLGLNNTFVRYLPTADDRDALITAGTLLVALCGTGIGLLYVLLTPVLAPQLAFVEHRPALAAGFVLLAAACAVNLLTDSIFVAARKAGCNALVDGGVGGVTKVVSGVTLVGTGAYGLFCASAGGPLAACLMSAVLMVTVLGWRPSLRKPFGALRRVLRFSGVNYAGNVLNLLPTLVVPLIVLDRLGAPAAAYYFVAFQVATLLYSGGYALEQAFLAEGSQAEVSWRQLLRRSRHVLMVLTLPACLVLVAAAHWILLVFGARYSQHGTPSLMLLAAAAIPLAANNWLITVLRLSGRLRAIVVSSGVYAVAICGLAWFLAPHGLGALTAAWPIGGLAGAAVAAASIPRREPPPDWRTASRTSPGTPAAAQGITTPQTDPGQGTDG